ncbi:MAG TPA: Crp/Fnr family transcriptional regulator [Microscillaceae bacterium]|nr:Crp/Fnr family transcriptional regulator [Microscillaceae bacterium]
MASIIDLIPPEAKLTPEAINTLKAQIQIQQYPKGTMLLKSGYMPTKSYFVKQGLLRSFVLDAKGKEQTFMFAPEGWIISDLGALTFQQSSQLSIEVLEDATVEVITNDFFEISEGLLSRLGINISRLLIKRNMVLQKRIIMLMSATAAERYQDFVETYPDIMQRVPLKMIATYLGITPEALSKIRGEIAKSNR